MTFRLIYLQGGQEMVFPLDKDEHVIGRAGGNDIVINHGSVSRRHARVFRRAGDWFVSDLGSTNGTLVNDNAGPELVLRSGDIIRVGDQRLSFLDEEAPINPLDSAPGPGAAQAVYRSTVEFGDLVGSPVHTGPLRSIQPKDLETLVTIVSAASKAILASSSLDEVFHSTMEVIFEHLPAERGFIMLRDEETGELVPRCSRSREAGVPASGMKFSRTIADKVLRERVAVLTRDAQMDDRFAQGVSVAALGIRSAIAAPLWNGERVDGLICLDNRERTRPFNEFELDVLSALGHHLAVAVEQARLQSLALEKERLVRELSVAREIQMDTLPKVVPTLAGYELAGISRPADQTGGDTYDLIPVGDHHVVLLLGDATGHGIGPALCATQVRAMLRVATRLNVDLDAAFRNINDQLVQDLADNRFVSAFIGVLDAGKHTVTYHSGGQGPILHYRAADGTFHWHPATTVPLGFLPVKKLKAPVSLAMEPGDILGLITDGVFEAEGGDGEMFREVGVERLLREHNDLPLAELTSRLLAAVDAYSGGRPQADDITIVFVRRRP